MTDLRRDIWPQPESSVSETVAQVSSLLEQSLPGTQVGQVWRASWDDDLVLCLILQIGDDHWVEVAPLVLDDDIGDPFSVTCDSSLSPLRAPFTVLAGMTVSVKEYVLDAYFGEVEPQVTDISIGLREDNLMGRIPRPVNRADELIRPGSMDAGDLDEKRDFRLEISHQLSRIASAVLLPETPSETATLHEILRESGIQLKDVRERLEISLGAAREIVRGAAALQPEHIELLADLPGLSQAKLAKAMPKLSPSYLSAVQLPAVSRLIRGEAKRTGVPPRSVVQSVPGRVAARRQHSYDEEGRSLSSDENYWTHAVIALLSHKGSQSK